MCTSYESNNPAERFDAFSMFPVPDFDYRHEIYKDYAAPVFRRIEGGWSTDAATFGMVPRKRIPPHIKVFDTMNARAETIGEKRSFSGAWNRLQLCLIPCQTFFEPNYETGKAVRWRIRVAGNAPTAVAGLWRAWEEPDGAASLSFTMLTGKRRRTSSDAALPQTWRREKVGGHYSAGRVRGLAIVPEHRRSEIVPAVVPRRRDGC